MKRFVLGCGMIWFATMVVAQSPDMVSKSRILTFEDAVGIAMKNSVLLNTQRNNLQYSQMQRTASIAGMGPSLQINGSLYEVNGNSFNNNTGKLINGVRDAMTGSLSANLNIFNGFAQLNRVKQFNSALDAQAYYVNRTAQDIINTVAGQYLTVLLDGELLRIAQENHLALQKQLEQVQETVQLGGRSPVDEYNQVSQTKAAELRALQAEITLINDKALLTQTLLLDPYDQIDVAKPKWDVNAISAETPALEELFETGLKNRGDYMRAIKNEDAARFGANVVRGLMTPTLSAFGNVGSAWNKVQGDSTARPFERQFKEDNLYKNYGLQLTIPILNGFQTRTQYVQQKVNYLNAQVNRKNAEIQVRTDILRNFQNFELYKKTYAVTLVQLEAAGVAFQLETERYNLGVTNFVDFSNANRNFVQAQTDKAQAEYRLVFQKILLEYATGTLRPEQLQDSARNN